MPVPEPWTALHCMISQILHKLCRSLKAQNSPSSQRRAVRGLVPCPTLHNRGVVQAADDCHVCARGRSQGLHPPHISTGGYICAPEGAQRWQAALLHTAGGGCLQHHRDATSARALFPGPKFRAFGPGDSMVVTANVSWSVDSPVGDSRRGYQGNPALRPMSAVLQLRARFRKAPHRRYVPQGSWACTYI